MTHAARSRKALGNFGENAVATMLSQQEYTILAQNFSWRGGEIDIIARKGDLVIFVEVKTRKTEYFSLSDLITPSKQLKVIKTAQQYALTHQLNEHVLRFDVALVLTSEVGAPAITYIPHAFSAPEYP